MNRRTFLKLSSLALVPLACQTSYKKYSFPIEVLSDHHVGHLLWKSQSFTIQKEIQKKDILIVGGGIAGLSAAHELQDKDFILCEVSDDFGGTSSAFYHNNIPFAQGAHYDLAYPSNYGKELLSFLENLNITEFNPQSNLWEFKETKYLIDHSIESRCFHNGKFQKDIFTDNKLTTDFYKVLSDYQGDMIAPTRLINKNFHQLANISFLDFLKNNRLNLNDTFINQIDYHMMDDYGGTTKQVSALAGIHYYQCRPYFTKPVQLFSPPQGNHYFIEKIHENIENNHQLKTNHLVKKITPINDKFQVEVINIKKQLIECFEVNKIVYAGTKHALKYVYPTDANLFEDNEYAPWIIVNVVIKSQKDLPIFWQNEMIVDDQKAFLGFVNSHSQFSNNNEFQILSAYYCFQSNERKKVLKTLESPKDFVHQTISYLSNYFDTDIEPLVEKVYLKGIGHAMAIPKPHFLLNDKNEQRNHENLVYAGVDNGRIPIFPEAIDSGIYASNLLNMNKF